MEEAYKFSTEDFAEDAMNVINSFNAFPVVLAIISLVIDFGISVFKLVVPISDKQDKILTVIEIILTFLFAPIAFPVSDFDYGECIATGLSDSIMESLDSYATVGFTMLLWALIVIAAIIIVRLVCRKNEEAKKSLTQLGTCVLVVIFFVYGALALLFIVLALLGTLNSLATGLLTGFSGIIEGIELYMAVREVQDVSNKVGLGS